MVDICLINRTSRIRDARFAAILHALQAQCAEDFCPVWGIAVPVLHLVGRNEQPDPSHWKLWFRDTSDDAGALGYHEDASGVPEGFVFVEDDIRYGSAISVTASHELMEMLADPTTTRMGPTIGGAQYIVECCDACEADEDGYLKLGVQVSNFVLPAYYGLIPAGGAGRGPYDFRDLLTAPCPMLRPGGYIMALENGAWTSKMARYEDGTLSHRAIKPLGRTARRAAKGVP